MRLSDDKITHLTHISLKGLLDKNIINILSEDSAIRREMRRVITNELKLAEDMDRAVRGKLASYSKKIPEGSPEWDILYHKFFHEEAAKKGRG
ncbi:MAG: DUF507 family protein [Nitrospirae bacterium]|nr:DUF507 family protein [Nitrospirota bacterium]